MPFPTWANLGPASGGTGPVTVNWPVNYASDDIGILICQSCNEAVVETSGGWTQVAASPQGIGTPGAPGSTRLTVFWKRVVNGGSEAPAQLADSGDHTNGIIAVIRGDPLTGDPIDVALGGTEAAVDTSLDLIGPATLTKDCLVLIIASHAIDTLNPEWSGATAPNLGGLIERYDKSITIGNGGGTAIWSGTLAGPGAVGNFSAIGDVASAKAWIVLALKPKPKLLNTLPLVAYPGPWLASNPGAGGTWAHVCAGPTGVIGVGADECGVYISKDRGQSWSNKGNRAGLNEQFVHAVCFDPSDPNIIYAASAHGVYRSGDQGDSWSLKSSDLWIGDVAISDADPTIVYAAYHPTQLDPATGILNSVDRGLTFSVVANNLPTNLTINRLMADPTNPSILYLVSAFHDFNHTPDDSIWRSADGGATWARISGPLEAIGTVWDCVLDRHSPTTLWATIYVGDPYNSPFTYTGSCHRSTDSGASWTNMTPHTGNVMVKYGRSDTIWIIDNKRNQGASEEGFWESTDGGASFSKKSTLGDYDSGWQPNVDRSYGAGNYGISHGFGQDLSDPDAVFQISPQFVHGSEDGGLVFYNLYTFQVTENHWATRRLENLTIAEVRISPVNRLVIFTGAFDTGMWRSVDGGISWETCNSADFTGDWNGEGGNTTTIVPDPVRGNVVWASQGRTETTSNLVKSLDTGEAGSWFAVSGLPADRFVYGLSLDRLSPSGNRTLFVTIGFNTDKSGKVYRSTDDGLNWTLVLDPDPTLNLAARVTAVDPFDSSVVYAGGEGGLWKSTTGGGAGSFSQPGGQPADFFGLTTGPGLNSIGALRWKGIAWIEVDPNTPNRLYVACYGDTGENRGLYVSNNAGVSWTKLYTGDYVRRCAVHPTNPNIVFLASSRTMTSPAANSFLSKGILQSSNAGSTWVDINDNLPWSFAGPIAVGGSPTYVVFVGSMGNGFWRRWFSAQEASTGPGIASEEFHAAPGAGTEASRASSTVLEESHSAGSGSEESRPAQA